MFIARWQIDASFGHHRKAEKQGARSGHKPAVIDLLRKWECDIGTKAGISAREATVEANHTIESIAQLERFFESIGKIDAHRQWGRNLEP